MLENDYSFLATCRKRVMNDDMKYCAVLFEFCPVCIGRIESLIKHYPCAIKEVHWLCHRRCKSVKRSIPITSKELGEKGKKAKAFAALLLVCVLLFWPGHINLLDGLFFAYGIQICYLYAQVGLPQFRSWSDNGPLRKRSSPYTTHWAEVD